MGSPRRAACSSADLDLWQSIEDIQLHQRQTSDAVETDRIVDDRQIHPAAATRASGDGAIFMTALLHFFANGVVQLRWEWTSANAGRVALDDTQHLVDMLWTNTSAYTAAPEFGLDEVTNGYVPWSISKSVPCAPSKQTFLPAFSASSSR